MLVGCGVVCLGVVLLVCVCGFTVLFDFDFVLDWYLVFCGFCCLLVWWCFGYSHYDVVSAVL